MTFHNLMTLFLHLINIYTNQKQCHSWHCLYKHFTEPRPVCNPTVVFKITVAKIVGYLSTYLASDRRVSSNH